MADDETSGVVEEAALVLTSYEKPRGAVEETRRGPKGPFVVGTALAGDECAVSTRKGYAKPLKVMRETHGQAAHSALDMGRALHSNSGD